MHDVTARCQCLRWTGFLYWCWQSSFGSYRTFIPIITPIMSIENCNYFFDLVWYFKIFVARRSTYLIFLSICRVKKKKSIKSTFKARWPGRVKMSGQYQTLPNLYSTQKKKKKKSGRSVSYLFLGWIYKRHRLIKKDIIKQWF